MTSHKIYFEAAKDLQGIADESVDLIVTSPPYPMIEMWDDIMGKQNPAIQKALKNGEGMTAFELMYRGIRPNLEGLLSGVKRRWHCLYKYRRCYANAQR